MRLLTNKYDDLLSCFDKKDESQDGIKGSALCKFLFDNNDDVADRRKVKRQLPLEHIFGFFVRRLKELQRI